jgi:hypothetical protein
VTSGTPPADGPELQDPPDGDHPTFDTSVAHVARIYDYWLGGKDNYAVDRAAGDAASLATDQRVLLGCDRQLGKSLGQLDQLDLPPGHRTTTLC